ncbi:MULTISPECIES: gamma-glutamyltransferase [unclassified Halomonas]|uniref:gamma-glutamyltransferase n=1 Tax=unclassified Halomonas TaxID=2609666 RepID=UPI00209DFE6B|nr:MULTISPECIES: gamma-glutamyltransferase [unclassified Halomonas]MCP1315422.1 gamma-glutamyltransferase [Halomonas sp. 707D7]MCP1326954.1 gamma-glutamyltransferase [Halomonas sp. 707D4]
MVFSTRNDSPALAHSFEGVVTSPHTLATDAGREVLRRGGNAVEAAIAMGACLGVTYPHFTGLGGDAFMIIADADGGVRTLSGIGQAPKARLDLSGTLPARGAGSLLTTAATVDTWGQAHEISRRQCGGTMSWQALLEPAIALARDGFEVSPSQRFWLDFRRDEMAELPGVRALFMPDGRLPQEGDTLRQPRLAASLEAIATRGHREFYEGELGARIAKGLAEAGSPLTAVDLAATRARIEAPLSVAYRGGVLLAHRPPTQGMTTLEIMGILERFDLSGIEEGSADYYHLLVEAVKRAFLDRNAHLADPDFASVPVERLLGTAHLDAQAAHIDPARALDWPPPYQHGDTVYLAAADRFGNAVSMLQTIYYDWGSGVTAGDTGILWHNRGAAFSLDPNHPNVLAPGKRPFHTLNPGMYRVNGKPRLLYGTQGADGQPQTLAAVLTRLIDYGLDPLSALKAPRFLLGRTFSDGRDTLKLEEDAGAEVVAELARRGHQVSLLSAQSALAGHPGAVLLHPEKGAFAAHDPRSDGIALGL